MLAPALCAALLDYRRRLRAPGPAASGSRAGTEAPAPGGLSADGERALARLLGQTALPSTPAARAQRWDELAALAAPGPGAALAAALDALGAGVCLRRAPQCLLCPVRPGCVAFGCGQPERYGRAPPRAPTPPVPRWLAFAYVARRDGTWLRRRPLDGLWPGLWEPPSASGRGAEAALVARYGPLGPRLAVIRHVHGEHLITAGVYALARPLLRDAADVSRFAAPFVAPLSPLGRKALIAAGA